MADAIQLLQLANQQTANLYNVIDRNLTQKANLQLQISNNEANLAMKGFEFGEQVRMNDARLEQAAAANAIQAQRFELEKQKLNRDMQLFPIQVETEKFKLENERTRAAFLERKAQNELFSDAIAPIQSKFAAAFASIQDPDMAREYTEIISRAKAGIASGNNINLEELDRNVSSLIDSKKDSPFKSDQYNPEVAQYLQVFAPNEAKRYETRNPTIQKNRSLLGGSMLTASDSAFAQIAEQEGHIFTPEETKVIVTGRTVVSQLESENNKIIDTISKLDGYAAAAKGLTDDQKKTYLSERFALTERLETNRKQINGIANNISSGNFSLDISEKPQEQDTPPAPTTSELESRFKTGAPSASSYLGLPNELLENKRDENRATRINQYVQDLKQATGRLDNSFPKEFLGIDFSYTLQTAKNDIPNFKTLANIKDTIDSNLRNLYGEGKEREFHKRYGENSIDNILKKIKVSHTVPLSEFAMEKLYGLRSFEVKSDTEVRGIEMGKSGHISSYKDMERLIDQIEDKDERKEVERELVSAILTLGIGAAIQD
jgi:hypothetical protein